MAWQFVSGLTEQHIQGSGNLARKTARELFSSQTAPFTKVNLKMISLMGKDLKSFLMGVLTPDNSSLECSMGTVSLNKQVTSQSMRDTGGKTK